METTQVLIHVNCLLYSCFCLFPEVHFKNDDANSADKKTNNEMSTNQVQYKLSLQNGDVNQGKQSKSKKKKHSKNVVEPSASDTDSSKEQVTNNNTGETNEKEARPLKKTLSTIDERAASRNSGKMDETKR